MPHVRLNKFPLLIYLTRSVQGRRVCCVCVATASVYQATGNTTPCRVVLMPMVRAVWRWYVYVEIEGSVNARDCVSPYLILALLGSVA